MKQILMRWIPVILWCGLIFFLSSQPHLPGPEDANLDFFVKKLGHITVYGILFFLTHRAFGRGNKHRMVNTFLFCICYAISDEYHQSYVPGRTPMVRDIGIDLIGMILSMYVLRKKSANSIR